MQLLPAAIIDIPDIIASIKSKNVLNRHFIGMKEAVSGWNKLLREMRIKKIEKFSPVSKWCSVIIDDPQKYPFDLLRKRGTTHGHCPMAEVSELKMKPEDTFGSPHSLKDVENLMEIEMSKNRIKKDILCSVHDEIKVKTDKAWKKSPVFFIVIEILEFFVAMRHSLIFFFSWRLQ